MRSVTNHLFFMVLLFGALHARSILSTASDTDFAPEFDRLSSTAAVDRPAPDMAPTAKNTATLDTSALEHAVFTHINLYLASKGMGRL